jgi:hypothetical protein
VTLALRLSAVGNDVLDGNGLAVSVDVSVGVTETVSVALGTNGVSVIGGNDVFVGRLVAVKVDGTGVDVNVQANDVMMHKIKIKGFRLIREILLYSNDSES